MLPNCCSTVSSLSAMKEAIRHMKVKPILGGTAQDKEHVAGEVSLIEFLKEYCEAERSFRAFLEHSKDRLFELRVSSVVREGKKVPLITFVDCTLAHRLEKLKAESKVKTLTMSVISHELRAPVNAVLGCLENIQKYVPSEGKAYVELAKNSCYMLSYQINDLTDYGKITDSELILDKARISLEDTVNECISLVSSQAKGKRLAVKYVKTTTSPVNIWANSRRIKQVLLNLLTNAIKFTQRGKIEVISRSTDTEALISVKDTGLGIKDSDKHKLFKEFSMLDDHRPMNSNGTGLGLYISLKLAHKMQGRITFASAHLKGSEFTVHLPLEPPGAAVNVSKPNAFPLGPDSAKPKCKCNHILAVDDTEANLVVIKGMLRLIGMECDMARNGLEAVEMARKKKKQRCCSAYRLILMDFHMPGMNGPEATEKIRKIAGESRVVGVTGDNAEDIPEETRNLFETVVSKPLALDKLKEILRSHNLLPG
eukprot:TRINITY_DN14633_c0_g1_i3.p1 TRINITY_DN14633_c0_g1~~TRINITY_DN14633_c0_g1_i3.p1  ORF type:complete len:482 (+),score=114.81 TRINITY_DN14633_c0_g1_i3:704-2149(+)